MGSTRTRTSAGAARPPVCHVSAPLVSIVLPTRNGTATLPAVLDAISCQRVDFPFEIIAVDSASTDGTVDLLRRRVDRVISISDDAFDHGLTRNLGIEQAQGELVVMLVQDAVPASESWLAALTAPLFADQQSRGHLRTAAASARRERRHALLPRAFGRVATWRGRSQSPRRRARGARSDGATRAVHIRQRLLLHPPFGVEQASVPSDADRRGHRVGEGGAAGGLQAGVTFRQAEVVHSHDRSARYEFAPNVHAPSPAIRTVPAAHHPDGAASGARDPSSLVVHRSASAAARHAGSAGRLRWRSRGRSGSISARCRR